MLKKIILIGFLLLFIASSFANQKYDSCQFVFNHKKTELAWDLAMLRYAVRGYGLNKKDIYRIFCKAFPNKTIYISSTGETDPSKITSSNAIKVLNNGLNVVKVKVNNCTFDFMYGINKSENTFITDNTYKQSCSNKTGLVRRVSGDSMDGTHHAYSCNGQPFMVVDNHGDGSINVSGLGSCSGYKSNTDVPTRAIEACNCYSRLN